MLDIRRVSHSAKKHRQRIFFSLMSLYFILPGVILISGSSSLVFDFFLGAVASGKGHKNEFLDLYLSLAFMFFIVHYLVICIMNLANPLGEFHGEGAASDAPLAEGYVSKFVFARLLPRLMMIPLILYFSYVIVYGSSWAVDMHFAGFVQIHLLTIFGSLLAFLFMLALSINVQLFVKTHIARFGLAIFGAFLAFVLYMPEMALGLGKMISGNYVEISFWPYLILWGFTPFGTMEAIDRFYLDWTSVWSRSMDPRAAVAIRAGVQIFVISALIFAAKTRFRKVFRQGL